MPKRKAATAFQAPTRGQLTRQQREQRNRLLVLGAAGTALFIALVIIGVGYYYSYVKPPRETAATVGDTTISMGYFAKRLKVSFGQFPGTDPATLAAALPEITLDDIIREELARKGAAGLGITVTGEDVDRAMADRLGVSLDDREAYDRAFRNDLEHSGLSLDEYRALAEARVYQERVRERLEADLPDAAPQVHVRLIEVRSEQEARKVIERLDGGEDFAVVAQEVSEHASKDSGGDAGWLVKETQDPAFEEAAFSLPIGSRSGPVKQEDGRYRVFQVLEREDARQLTDQQREELLTAREDRWYKEQEEKIGVERKLTDDKVRWALERVFG